MSINNSSDKWIVSFFEKQKFIERLNWNLPLTVEHSGIIFLYRGLVCLLISADLKKEDNYA